MLGIYNNYLHGAKAIGERWAPKAQRLMVGRDVASIQKSPEREKTNGIVLADSVRQLEAAISGHSQAAASTRLGFSLKQGIDVSPAGQEQLLAKGAGSSVYLFQSKEGKASLRIADANGEERLVELSGKEDIRIGWGKDGKAEVFTGQEAKNGGKLAAKGENEILVRLSNSLVEAGKGSTVLNLGGAGGKFSGGHNVRYLGNYEQASIEGGSGTTYFEGNFGNTDITAEKGAGEFSGTFYSTVPSSIKTDIYDDVFSGHFQGVSVSDAGGANTFSGTFTTGSKIDSGSGDDTFSGQFFDTNIKDLGGSNTFGSYIDLKEKVKANFVRTVIESGDGNDKFIGAADQSDIKLGGGDDEVEGILLGSSIDAGEGSDKIRILYADASIIEAGAGDDEVHLVTGSANNVYLGQGNDKMTSGLNRGADGRFGTMQAFTDSAFITEQQAMDGMDPKYGHHFGDVQTSHIDAGEGENSISVHDGQNVHSVLAGAAEASAPKAEKEPGQKPEDDSLIDAKTRTDSAKLNSLTQALGRMLERTRRGGDNAISPEMADKLEQLMQSLEAGKAERAAQNDEAGRRLLTMLGGWMPKPGGNSVTIDAGGGQTVAFDRMERHFFEGARENDNAIRASLRKYRQFCGINS